MKRGHLRGGFHRTAQPPGRFLADQPQIPDRPHTPVVGRCADLFHDIGDDLDECCKLVGIALQVFGGQQIDGGQFDAGFVAPPQHFGDLGRTHPVAVADVVVARAARPSPVAVAQHGYVPGQVGFQGGQALPQAQLVEPVQRLFEPRRDDLHRYPDYCDPDVESDVRYLARLLCSTTPTGKHKTRQQAK
ncbi:Uncharacterised protein [Mycobacterium tuberculosis]|nr:Uncharacterised protein [Mycobacterium tuberculosis]